MEGRIKLRVDLQANKYDDVEDRDTVILKDPISGKFFYLTVYEYRLLKTLDGNRSLEEALELLGASGIITRLKRQRPSWARQPRWVLFWEPNLARPSFRGTSRNKLKLPRKPDD